MEKLEFLRLREAVLTEVLPNGLHIFVVPKKGFGKSFACFATDYGGADRRFKYGGEWTDTPAGVAHFLEHKMFDTKDGNALNLLSANGASPNAWTSAAMTAYHFEATEDFYGNLETLLSFVSVPWFTPESVAKERGIIGQEIRMMDDTPGFAVYMNLLRALYRENPVRDPVAGSEESIAEITDRTLYACHKVFYNPSNMALCVAGDVDPARVADTAERILPKSPGERPERDYGGSETKAVYTPETRARMEVSAPQFLFGCRMEPGEKGAERLRRETLCDLALLYLMGKTSPFYTELYSRGLIKNDFDCEQSRAAGSAVVMAGGESRKPEAVLDRFLRELELTEQNGVDETRFRLAKNTHYGSEVRGADSFSGLCFRLASGCFGGFMPLDTCSVLETVTPDELSAFIRDTLRPDGFALSIISEKDS